MHIVADLLTTLRFLLSVVILYVGLQEGPIAGIATASLLTILAWITDVLDGPLARHASHHTRLGHLDLPADLSLTLALTVCLVAWGIVPLSLVAGGILLTSVAMWVLHHRAPLQFTMGMIYGTFIFGAQRISPAWGRALTGGVGLVVLLNPTRAWGKVTSFLRDVQGILRGRAAED